MKRSIKGYEEMTHQGLWYRPTESATLLLISSIEIMDILRVKKAHLPPASSARRRKVTSAASVDDQDGHLDPGLSSSHVFQTPVLEVGCSESTQDKDIAGSLDNEE
jgi:hypothetical protein